MSSLQIQAESSEFVDLTDAYTGVDIKVYMKPTPDGPLFFSPDATSPRALLTTELKVQTCPYTGETFKKHKVASGWFMSKGFDPRLPRQREEFLYYVTMRDGKSKYPKPSGLRVETVLRSERISKKRQAHVDKSRPQIDEFHVHSIENSLKPFKDIIPGSSTVSMYTGGSK
jgi:hypothetical protein